MTTYIVTYDLRKPGRNYEPVYDYLKTFTRWGKITESCWAVVTTTKTAVNIRDDLNRLTDTNDRIFVIKSGVEAAWRNTKCDSEWLKTNL